MRGILLVFFVISVSLSEAISKKDWRKLRCEMQEKCSKEIGIDKGVLDKWKKSRVVPELDEKFLEFIYCLAVDAGFIDKKGNLQFDRIRKHLKDLGVKEVVAKKSIKNCNKVEKSECVLLQTIRYYVCYGKYLPREVLVF
ncbi:uncharacterized protein LOC123308236 [Coccinella septempunctata]|uniref:uncharacterized protein LOC123308236 n=1 Tax=Coccinella septempunctata TaxID=41139 RepID=UPI001D0694C4|nr:uncharacterized protein LOC123308236 [Coccinella septempunctata]